MKNNNHDSELRDLLLDHCRTDKQAKKIMRLDSIGLAELASINYETGVIDSDDIPPDLLDYIDSMLESAG